jgi:hypothetical protein
MEKLCEYKASLAAAEKEIDYWREKYVGLVRFKGVLPNWSNISNLLQEKTEKKLKFLQQRLFALHNGKDLDNSPAGFPGDHELIISFESLYNDEALDAFEEFDSQKMNSEIIVKMCKQFEIETKKFVFSVLSNVNRSLQIGKGRFEKIPLAVIVFVCCHLQATFSDWSRVHFDNLLSNLIRKIFNMEMSIWEKQFPCLKHLACKLLLFCMQISIAIPSKFEFHISDTEYNSEIHHRCFGANKNSSCILSYEWPTLLLDGKVVCKGFVKT